MTATFWCSDRPPQPRSTSKPLPSWRNRSTSARSQPPTWPPSQASASPLVAQVWMTCTSGMVCSTSWSSSHSCRWSSTSSTLMRLRWLGLFASLHGRFGLLALFRGHLVDVGTDPVDYAAGSVLAAFGLAFTQEVVVFTWVQHHLGWRLTRTAEADEQFFGLALGTALVVLALQEQRGRGRLLHVLQRRQLARFLTIEPGRCSQVQRVGVVAAVRSAVVRFDVADRSHHDRGAKLGAVAYGPGREVAAVGLARDGQSIVADAFISQLAQRGQVLRQVHLAPVAREPAAEFLAETAGTHRVEHEDGPSLRAQHLPEHVGVEVQQRVGTRAAVRVVQQRHGAGRALGMQEPALDGLRATLAVGHRELASLELQRRGFAPPRIQGADPPFAGG